MAAQPLRIDERNHVEKPFLDQLAGLGWEIVDLDNKQRPVDSFRESFAEVVMLPVLREQLKVINPWLEEDQVEEAVRRLTVGFPSTGLLENNRHVFDLLLSNTSVSGNRQTGERSPTVRDRYTMRQSIEDGVMLQIIYEGRTHKAEVPDRAALDAAFEDVFSECDLQERLKILGYGSRDAYLEAESTIEAKARDMVDHYLTHVYPNGYKAQVVATSREASVRYKTHVDAALGARTDTRRRRQEVGAVQPRPAGPDTAQGDADGRHHFRKSQRSAAPEGLFGPIEARNEHQEFQAALRRRRRGCER